jgi:GT2 family glycosyltransferase
VTPPVSIVFPTRRRHDYLSVALESVAAQGREHGAEIVIVEDDHERPVTRRLAEVYGASYVALGSARGINVARNAGVTAARAELVAFLDDDVEVWPGWLDALLAAAGRCPGHEAFGGPIRPRLEGVRLRTCGREPVPITSLDLGAHDRDADFAWGANFALRRSAIARIGGFDEQLNFCGDEEDWQRRLRAAGGRVRYVAAAGVDHRRAGADARLGALMRAAHQRGRHARRYDERKGTAPPLGAELRVLAGCAWHAARRSCANGVVLAAMSAGRLRTALASARTLGAGRRTPDVARGAPRSPACAAAPADFLSERSGTLSRRSLVRGHVLDALADAVMWPQRRMLARAAARAPVRRILVHGVIRPENAARVRRIRDELDGSRHLVDVHLEPGRPGDGKWENLNAALAEHPPAGHDWLLLIDDDVWLPKGFLDAFLFCCERHRLALAQPAHAYASHAAWPVTRRRPGLVVRETRFVEIGPVTAVAAPAFGELLPFPALRMGWGLDFHWAAVVAAAGRRIGIVDATPIRHATPVATGYPREAAVAEGVAFLAQRPRRPMRGRDADVTVRRHFGWRE